MSGTVFSLIFKSCTTILNYEFVVFGFPVTLMEFLLFDALASILLMTIVNVFID